MNASPVDGGGPPEGEPTIGNLVETRPLRIGELLELHRLLKATGLFPGCWSFKCYQPQSCLSCSSS